MVADADERELTLRIKRRLGSVWQPFFGGFGRLTPVQLAVIPAIFKGHDVIACAPTASGKTEAAFAPLVRRVLDAPDRGAMGVRLLYVVPTRALVNNIDHRMRGPVREVGLRLAVRTGDRPEVNTSNPEEVLVTTPESLDSLLCRYPAAWSALQAVVLDEIHLLDGTARGDQLRGLMRRLELVRQGEVFQTAMLSATLHDPDTLARRYVPGGAEVVDLAGARTLKQTVVESLEEVVALLREEELHKALAFCNTRREVEEVALALRDLWPKDRIAVHHGSLAKKERESVESAMRSWKWGVLVATMTLELGIDVGDIDAVVLVRPPPSPSSYQQRIGRANRRGPQIRVVGFARTDAEREQFEVFAGLARDGVIEATDYAPDVSVALQQLMSHLFQKKAPVPLREIIDLLSPLADEETVRSIVAHLDDHGYIRRLGERIAATERVMDLGERGTLHSNIGDSKEFSLVDATTGAQLGKATLQAVPGARLLFGGRGWMVREVQRSALLLVPVPRDQAIAWFKARLDVGAFNWLLPPELRAS